MSIAHRSTVVPFYDRHDDELVPFAEACDVLCTAEHTMRYWRQDGRGPRFFKMGRRLYTTVGDLRAFMRQQRLAGTPDLPAPRRY